MAKRRLPIGVLALFPICAGFALYAFTGQQTVPPAVTTSPGADVTASVTRSIEPTPASPPAPLSPPAADVPGWSPPPLPTPTAWPTPVMARGAFHDGAWVRVTTDDGDCLNARSSPIIDAKYVIVNECLPDGSEGYLVGPATQTDGRWWWRIAGAGYVAEEFLTYVREADLTGSLVIRGEAAPAGVSGKIAFVRDPGIWVMDADGGNQVQIATLEERSSGANTKYFSYPTDLSWSPDGTMLSYNVAGEQGADPQHGRLMDLHIVRADGTQVRTTPSVAGRGWSPDSERIGIVIGTTEQEMGGGWTGVPAWQDVVTGAIHQLDSESFYQQDPPAFNFDGSLLLVTRYEQQTAEDGTVTGAQTFVVIDAADNVVARVTSPGNNSYYGSPTWSPTANQIAFYEQRGDAYAVYDLAARSIVAESPLPAYNPNRGGGCGASDMYRTSWSRDGRILHYAFMYGLGGTNGAWGWDVVSGGKRVVPAPGVRAPSAGPGTLSVFSADGYIFIGDASTGARTLLTDGGLPAWSR